MSSVPWLCLAAPLPACVDNARNFFGSQFSHLCARDDISHSSSRIKSMNAHRRLQGRSSVYPCRAHISQAGNHHCFCSIWIALPLKLGLTFFNKAPRTAFLTHGVLAKQMAFISRSLGFCVFFFPPAAFMLLGDGPVKQKAWLL